MRRSGRSSQRRQASPRRGHGLQREGMLVRQMDKQHSVSAICLQVPLSFASSLVSSVTFALALGVAPSLACAIKRHSFCEPLGNIHVFNRLAFLLHTLMANNLGTELDASTDYVSARV